MAINLYSKASTDALLAAKLDDAPSDGTTYGRKDATWVAVSGGASTDTLTANAIASNIAYLSGSVGNWIGNSQPTIAGLATWGVYNSTDGYISFSYSSSGSFFLSGSVTVPGSYVQVSGSNSSFTIS